MGDRSAIEWTKATWNPIRGCTRVSEGCRNCYAERTAIRQAYPARTGIEGIQTERDQGAYYSLVRSTPSGPRWTGEVRFVPELLDLPLRWKAPRRIFVNSMSDLFHEKVDVLWFGRIMNIMAQAQHHTFQVLTKRPRLMLDRVKFYTDAFLLGRPLPNVWLGVSVEDQATADERIPLLLQTPAAVRWVSYEPALGPVDFEHDTEVGVLSWLRRERINTERENRIDWVVVGGESGPGSRPFDLAWARQTIAQCRAAGVPVFVKQLGARPVAQEGFEWEYHRDHVFGLTRQVKAGPDGYARPVTPDGFLHVRDRKGGDPSEWPEDFRVREYPASSVFIGGE